MAPRAELSGPADLPRYPLRPYVIDHLHEILRQASRRKYNPAHISRTTPKGTMLVLEYTAAAVPSS